MNHTVTLAISINAIVTDDQGDVVQEIILPLWYLFLWLPARAYNALLRAPGRVRDARWRLGRWLRGWRDDLAIIAQAAALLVRERGFAE